jgi:flavin-binding protein dodecin
MISREEYIKSLKAQLDQWERQTTMWETAAREATAEARTELEKQVGIMKSRADDLVYRMELMKGASADAWQEIARGADEARKTMQDAFEKARFHFKDV